VVAKSFRQERAIYQSSGQQHAGVWGQRRLTLVTIFLIIGAPPDRRWV
jgi:hypothetical protein